MSHEKNMIATSITKNLKIFFLNQSQLDDRLDPVYYKLKSTVLNKFKFPLEKIGNSFFVKDGDHDKLPDEAIARETTGRRYLRAQDLKGNKIINENPVYVTEDYFKSVKRCHIYPGDLLFSIMASIGATAIVPVNYPICTANRAVGILRKKANSVFLPEYVQALFNTNLGQAILEIEKRGGIQQRLNLSDISDLRIPAPPVKVQNQIINIYHEGLCQKEQKELEAKQIRSSIDSYILSELGISLPEDRNELESRIFYSRFSEVSGSRFDPYFFKNTGFIASNIYPNRTLKELTVISKGQSITKDKITLGNYPVIAGGQSSPYTHNEYNFDENVITISASGAYSGFVWFHNYKIFASDCIVLRSNNEDEVMTEYIYYVLKSLQQEIYKLQQGAGQPHVYAKDVQKLNIPIPPIKKQKEMLKKIIGMRDQIKNLEESAKNALGVAIKDVEKVILS